MWSHICIIKLLLLPRLLQQLLVFYENTDGYPAAVIDKIYPSSWPTPDKWIPPPDEKYMISASFLQFQWTRSRHGPWRTHTKCSIDPYIWCGHIARRIYWLDVKMILRQSSHVLTKNQKKWNWTRGGGMFPWGASFLIGTMIKHRFKRFHKGSWHIWHWSATLTVAAGSSEASYSCRNCAAIPLGVAARKKQE